MTDSRREIYRGKIVTLRQEQVTLPNGHVFELEIVHHPGGVGILALDAQQRLCMLRQFRYVASGWIWEIPAGKIDQQEATLLTAKRELQEEAGILADSFVGLGRTITSPGIFTEVIHFYLATGLHPSEAAPEHEEIIEIHWLPLTTVREMIASGEILDAKTIVGVTLLTMHLDRNFSATATT